MEIIKVTPRGYCRGVTRAIHIAKKTAEDYPDKEIYILGMLVHNTYVIKALEQLHIKTIDDKTKTRAALLELIPDHSVVIFTAHGIHKDVIKMANDRGLICIDASCPDVIKTQEVVQDALDRNHEVLYIGKKNHPEAEAILHMSTHVHLITNGDEIKKLPLFANVFVTNQTTMSIFDIENLFDLIKEKYQNAEFCEEICNATRIRQQAVADLQHQNIDLLYVVGDAHSNNSTRLAQIAKEHGVKQVYLIDDINGIQDEHLKNAKRIAITAGASTPTYLTNQVIQYLKHYEQGMAKETIEIHKIL